MDLKSAQPAAQGFSRPRCQVLLQSVKGRNIPQALALRHCGEHPGLGFEVLAASRPLAQEADRQTPALLRQPRTG
ncbi:MAG: hypothetical protein Q7U56_11955 [Humidesulfovibrio sp.]|nr:hypothetical protein [Humidesulfovibrio sp.]